uniref:Si:ch1073-126c3.2 n=1 Tax=Cynoglossus semilaevis TaxID=244447 RepID=A0A3P8WSY1_CYNSE
MILHFFYRFKKVLHNVSCPAVMMRLISSPQMPKKPSYRVAECDWSPQQAATLLLTLRNVTELLNDRQKECHIEKPPLCPTPEVPENGGLGCVTVGKRYFCKPMCNHGFDFTFLRRSLLFNECSEQTHNRWNTQYIGGNKLAVCQESALQISGRTSAYFPENQDCLMTKSQLKEAFIKGLITELQSLGIQGKPGTACLICG